MKRHLCAPAINRPALPQPWIEASDADERLGREIAAEIARVIAKAGAENGPRDRTDCLSEMARDRLARMTVQGRRNALAASRRLAGGKPRADGPGLPADLRKGIAEMARRHFGAQKETFSRAIKAVVDQARPLQWVRTTVGMRPDAEIPVHLVQHTCMTYPEKLICEWESTEPGATRAYWELRGPALPNSPGKLLARGYSDGTPGRSGKVKGSFRLDLAQYFPPPTPDPTQRYTVRVLPLAAPDAVISFGVHRGHSLTLIGSWGRLMGTAHGDRLKPTQPQQNQSYPRIPKRPSPPIPRKRFGTPRYPKHGRQRSRLSCLQRFQAPEDTC